MSNSKKIELALPDSHLAPYLNEASGDSTFALELYSWNARISGDFWFPLHICEVVARTSIAEAVNGLYKNWPYNASFVRQLNETSYKNLQQTIDRLKDENLNPNLEQITTNLTFGFWVHLLTKQYQDIWKKQLTVAFPYIEKNNRQQIYDKLNKIKTLRNKIAHHESLLKCDLKNDYQNIISFIGYRCETTKKWVEDHQKVTQSMLEKPQV
jgi:hypothetical protein